MNDLIGYMKSYAASDFDVMRIIRGTEWTFCRSLLFYQLEKYIQGSKTLPITSCIH